MTTRGAAHGLHSSKRERSSTRPRNRGGADVAPGPKAGALPFVRRGIVDRRGGQGRDAHDTFDKERSTA